MGLFTVAAATCHRYPSCPLQTQLGAGRRGRVSCVSGTQIRSSAASSFLPVAPKTRASDAKAAKGRPREGAGPPPLTPHPAFCQAASLALPGCREALHFPSF